VGVGAVRVWVWVRSDALTHHHYHDHSTCDEQKKVTPTTAAMTRVILMKPHQWPRNKYGLNNVQNDKQDVYNDTNHINKP
jgi:hypothetical protein